MRSDPRPLEGRTRQMLTDAYDLILPRGKDEAGITLLDMTIGILPTPPAIPLRLEEAEEHAQMGFMHTMFFKACPERRIKHHALPLLSTV
jgi:hypothetical protein